MDDGLRTPTAARLFECGRFAAIRVQRLGSRRAGSARMQVIGHSFIIAAILALGIFAAVAGLALSPAYAAGDIESGEKIFAKCKACHTVMPDKHRVGPSLAGVIGRTAGTAPGYKYSKAMQAYGASGIDWNEQTLDTYLTNPRQIVKGTKMTFPGLKDPEQRADLIAYLKQASKPSE